MEENDLTYPIDHELKAKDYLRLGWRNFWTNKTPEVLTKCSTLGHKTVVNNHSIRGSDHTIRCDTCKYFYKLDSSD